MFNSASLTRTHPLPSRLVNLELLQKFGANAWRLHNYQLEQQLKQTQRATEESRQRIVELNRQRKAEQVHLISFSHLPVCGTLFSSDPSPI